MQQKCEPPTLGWALAGFAFIRHNERLLGIIALDLLVVLLGGFTPCLRSSERHFAIRPIGLGPLRSSPAVGALITALWLSHHPLEQRIGFRGGVRAGRRYPSACQPGCRLRCLRLPCFGASDALSVVIRFSLVQIETPDEKRVRVSAVNYLFVGSPTRSANSNRAPWPPGSAVPSVLIGGIGSLAVAAVWMLFFPALRRIDRYKPANKES